MPSTGPPVRLLEERRYDPPRHVLVEHEGRWWPGFQSSWRLCDDGRGWMAEVTWSADHEWGWGQHVAMAKPERVRPRGDGEE